MFNTINNTLINVNKKANLNNSYFSKQIESFYNDFQYKQGDICLFNTNIPIEIILANNLNPKFMLGGTLNFDDVKSDLFPRDVDKAVHSSYLYFKEFTKNYDGEISAVIVLINDSYRKLASMLEDEGVKVITIDYFQSIVSSDKFYKRKLSKFKSDIKKVSRILLVLPEQYEESTLLIYNVRNSLQVINDMWFNNKTINIYDYLLLVKSFYVVTDFNEYLTELNNFIESNQLVSTKESLSVGILGSPIYFPNTKIIDLFSEFNVDVFLIDNDFNYYLKNNSNNPGDVNYLVNQYFSKEDYTKNIDTNLDESCLSDTVDGYIYIALKGQVVSDFNYDKYDQLNLDSPLLKLETDYYNEDYEQLKIRVEAFVEMLRHRKGD